MEAVKRYLREKFIYWQFSVWTSAKCWLCFDFWHHCFSNNNLVLPSQVLGVLNLSWVSMMGVTDLLISSIMQWAPVISCTTMVGRVPVTSCKVGWFGDHWGECMQAFPECTETAPASRVFSYIFALKSIYNILSYSVDIVIIADPVWSCCDRVVCIYLCR